MKQILIIMFSLVLTFVYATIINVPGDQLTIQAGINAAANSDTVLVQPETYDENINFNGKLITVASLFLNTQDSTYISSTTIDGSSSGSVVTFNNSESSSSILCGFTITNGSAGFGGGIYCNSNSSPSLDNLTISDNSASSGGGLYCNSNSSPSLQSVTISGNSASNGGGIYCVSSSPSLKNVTITANTGSNHGGGIYCNLSSPSLENVTISDNIVTIYDGGGIWCNLSNPILNCVVISDNSAYMYGGGIYCDSSSPSLENVTITENNAGWYGGGILCFDNSSPSLINSIMWDDSPEEISIASGSVTATYSDIEGGWTGTGNINSDPLFINAGNGDYHLQSTSPCIDAGDPASTLDPDGTRADMGALFYDQSANAGTGSGTSTDGELVVIDVIPIDFGNGFIDPDVTFDPDTGPVTVDVVVSNAVQVGTPPPNPGNVALSYALTFTGTTAQTFHMILSYSGYSGTPAYIAWWNGSVWQVPDAVVFTSPEVSFDITPASDRSGGEIEKGLIEGLRDGTFEFILGDDNPLPVNLSAFYALYFNGTPTLYWTTQSEENNEYWNVYRGTSDNFAQAIWLNAGNPIPGNGTINTPSDYIYVDTAPVIQNTTYWYWIEDISLDGESGIHEPITLDIPFDETPPTPDFYGLHQNYPNPFNPSTSISFALEEESNVEVIVYNIKGEKIKTIFNDQVYADQIQIVVWDGKDVTGKQVSSGIYLYKLNVNGNIEAVKKCVLVK
ncbi:MAG: T9SS type A sorting domain-containing protein [Candidatus Cloacimonetes bacterium]|nr:T9SS type A sorting domain-containing protein [Candidatus Cloacimonadota bacterium]